MCSDMPRVYCTTESEALCSLRHCAAILATILQPALIKFYPMQELEQENYLLKMKLECQQLSSKSLQQELESTLAKSEKEQATREKRLEEVHSKKVLELTLLHDDFKAEIGKLNVRLEVLDICIQDIYVSKLCTYATQVQVKTFQERIMKQEEIIEQLREEASCRGDASMLHNELMDLENLCSNGEKLCLMLGVGFYFA